MCLFYYIFLREVYFVILTMTCSDCWTLLLGYLKYLLNINFEYVYIVFYSLNWLLWCGFYMWNGKSDGYPIPARNLTGMSTGMNFYQRVWVRISTRSLFAGGWVIALPDPLSSLIPLKPRRPNRWNVATSRGVNAVHHLDDAGKYL
jgi:hypothetical protein